MKVQAQKFVVTAGATLRLRLSYQAFQNDPYETQGEPFQVRKLTR